MYLSLYCKGSKRVTQGFTVRGSWRPNKDCNILTPLLWPSALCLSHSPDVQPEARGLSFLLSAGFLYYILSPTDLRNYWGPRGPLRPRVGITVMQFTGHSLPVHHSVAAQWDLHLVPYYQLSSPARFLSINGHWDVSLPSGASP